MPKIKRYKNNPPLKPNALHRETELKLKEGTVTLKVDDTYYDVEGLTLQEMEIRYSQDLEQGEKALLFFEDATETKTYRYDKKIGQWLLVGTGAGHIEGGTR